MQHLLHERDEIRVALPIGEVRGRAGLRKPRDKRADEPERGGRHQAVAILIGVDLVGSAPAQAPLPLRDRRLPAPSVGEEPLHQHLLGAGDQRLVRGEVDVVTGAARVPQPHFRQRADRRIEPDGMCRLVAVAGEGRCLRRSRH